MKIANPWPYHAMSRCICKTPAGDQVRVQTSRGPELEVPDGSTEVMIEPVKQVGRGGKVEAIGQGRIWSEAWGLLDIVDHLKKQEIEAEETAMKERVEKERERKAQEARERGKAQVEAKLKAKEKEEAEPKAEPKPEPKAEPESDGPDMDEWAAKANQNEQKEQK
jgi:hypothetical protein